MRRLAVCAGALLLTVACGNGSDALSATGAPPRPIDPAQVPPTIVGMNLAPPNPFGNAPTFANLVQAHGDYWLITDHGAEMHSPQVALDASGHPIHVAKSHEISIALMPDPKTSTRTIACTGSPGWSVAPEGGPDLGSPPRFRFPLTVDAAGQMKGQTLHLTALHDDAALPHLDCRDARVPVGAIFDPELLEELKPFRVVRFMEWMQTNGAPHRGWNDRPTPGDFNFIQRGVPVEYMVALANEGHVDPWFTLPWDSTDEYYRNFATYVRDHLASDRKAYVELSNEVWNGAFKQSQDAAAQGKLLYPGEPESRAADFVYADHTRALMAIWSEVFRGQEKRLVRVASSMAVLPDRAGDILGHKQTWRSIDLLATAPYFGTNGFEVQTKDASTRINTLFAQGPAVVDHWIQLSKQAKAAAAKYGVRYGTYEGGPGYLNGMPDMQKQLTEMARDPRMYDLYTLFLNRWQKEVGGLFMAFTSVGDPGQYGSWGHKEYPSQPLAQAHKWRALVDFAARQPAGR